MRFPVGEAEAIEFSTTPGPMIFAVPAGGAIMLLGAKADDMRPRSPRPRLPAWPDLLMAYLDRATAQPFAWGERDADCSLFAAGAVEALTGKHPCPWLIGQYRDEEGASRQMEGLGGLEAATTAMLGPPLANKLMARRGDVALFMLGDTEPVLAVHLGDQLACKGPGGVGYVNARRAVTVWPVGRTAVTASA